MQLEVVLSTTIAIWPTPTVWQLGIINWAIKYNYSSNLSIINWAISKIKSDKLVNVKVNTNVDVGNQAQWAAVCAADRACAVARQGQAVVVLLDISFWNTGRGREDPRISITETWQVQIS
jgi:hypothetical protein